MVYLMGKRLAITSHLSGLSWTKTLSDAT